MSRTGPPPKDPSIRARRNKDTAQLRVLEARPVGRPDLPEFRVMRSYKDPDTGAILTEFEDFDWPEVTRDWWAMLDRHPLAKEFIDADWSYLLETARIHAAFWLGDLKLGGELRMRESKYGFTPEDRLKLRLTLAVTTEAEERVAERGQSRPSVRKRGEDPRLKLVQ